MNKPFTHAVSLSIFTPRLSLNSRVSLCRPPADIQETYTILTFFCSDPNDPYLTWQNSFLRLFVVVFFFPLDYTVTLLTLLEGQTLCILINQWGVLSHFAWLVSYSALMSHTHTHSVLKQFSQCSQCVQNSETFWYRQKGFTKNVRNI